ncbi:spore-associated protein A [Streptomyces sp. NPDC050264]|uniref:spore-associated protein A n=1 Tax=Streptomyces sp. NPDC050264 TaxID=3155038 RepID=UPI003439373A
MATVGLTLAASPAQAAGYSGACGSGYSVIDSMSVTNGLARAYLTYNSSNGYNCVVTMNNTGSTHFLDAAVEVSGGDWVRDRGNYKSYAGPVYVYAAGKCIDWGGSADSATVNLKWNDHCG